jgi:hypothetical protein
MTFPFIKGNVVQELSVEAGRWIIRKYLDLAGKEEQNAVIRGEYKIPNHNRRFFRSGHCEESPQAGYLTFAKASPEGRDKRVINRRD